MYFLCKEKQHCQWKLQWIQPFCSEVSKFCEELSFIFLSILENIKRYPSWVGNKQISGVYNWRQCHFSVADIGVTDRDILCKSHWCYIGMFLVSPQKIINHITAACEMCASIRVSHNVLFLLMRAYKIMTEHFREFQSKLHCGNIVNMPYTLPLELREPSAAPPGLSCVSSLSHS